MQECALTLPYRNLNSGCKISVEMTSDWETRKKFLHPLNPNYATFIKKPQQQQTKPTKENPPPPICNDSLCQ